MEVEDKTLVGCIGITVGLIAAPVLYILNGWVLRILWGWFITPFGPPVPSIPLAIGISLVVGFLTHRVSYRHNKDDRAAGEKLTDDFAVILAGLIGPFITLGIGYIISGFIQ